MQHFFAQTHLQLLAHLRSQGYPFQDQQRLNRAYELAVRLFVGRFRPSGKPFLAHLVGTASILFTYRAPLAVGIAGLLHAAYREGDFWDGRGGQITPKRQQQVRRVVGEEVESYIARYSSFTWHRGATATLGSQIDTLTSLDRQVVLMRLANELEEYLDYGVLYNGVQLRQTYQAAAPHIAPLARTLGYPDLADECDRILTLVYDATDRLADLHPSYAQTYAQINIYSNDQLSEKRPPGYQIHQGMKQLSLAARYLVAQAFSVY
jgi:(p)ppGpp synthase/HD superfamily hydrolase